jgi:hypothetical protein
VLLLVLVLVLVQQRACPQSGQQLLGAPQLQS